MNITNTNVSTSVVREQERPGFSVVNTVVGLAMLVGVVLAPRPGWACACGCGVFDVGTGLMLPEGAGGMVYVDYDYQDQDQNWHGTSSAPAANNGDKEIRTHFVTAGLQYMFDRSWGLEVEVPYDDRYFKTSGGASGNDIVSLDWATLGDIRVEGVYTGFSPDMSTGINFGFKLPTGDYTHNNAFGDIDRDTELGSGSTDILLGGFHRGNVPGDIGLTWFAQALLDLPVITRDDYRPGIEFDTAAGVYYKGWLVDRVRITPVAQVIASERTSDQGAEASGHSLDDPDGGIDSGYQRIMLSPGIELDMHPVSFYADVEVPVFQDFRGNQLVAPWLVKATMSYHF